MAKEGYVAFVITARARRAPGADPLPLDNLDGKGLDLIDELRSTLSPLVKKVAPETEPRYENAYSFVRTDFAWSPHAVIVDGEAGPYGAAGRMVDIVDGSNAPFDQKKAAMVPIRAMIMRWPGATRGLLISERRSLRNLRKAVEDGVLKRVGRSADLTFTVATHIDAEAWEEFLGNAQVAQVKAVYRSTRLEDYEPDVRTRPSLTISAEGSTANRLGRSALGAALRKAKGQDAGAILLGDLEPKHGEGYTRESISITARGGDDVRAIEIENGELPQWVYRTAKRLTKAQAKDTWAADVSRLLGLYGVDVPGDWHTAP